MFGKLRSAKARRMAAMTVYYLLLTVLVYLVIALVGVLASYKEDTLGGAAQFGFTAAALVIPLLAPLTRRLEPVLLKAFGATPERTPAA